jgi:hypothetical protein
LIGSIPKRGFFSKIPDASELQDLHEFALLVLAQSIRRPRERFQENLFRGGSRFHSSTDRHVYVIAAHGKPGRTIAMNDGNIAYEGVIRANSDHADWIGSSPPSGKKYSRTYDLTKKEHRVVITDQPYTGGSDRLVRLPKSAV